jgi:hypothetical protein
MSAVELIMFVASVLLTRTESAPKNVETEPEPTVRTGETLVVNALRIAETSATAFDASAPTAVFKAVAEGTPGTPAGNFVIIA